MAETLNLAEWDEFSKALLDTLAGDGLIEIMEYATKRAVIRFDQIVRDTLPPKQIKREASPYWTPRQLRWWWATMHAKALGRSRALPGWKAEYEIIDGRRVLVISGAYKRTGTLIKSMSYEITSGYKDGFVYARANYGTNRPYAKWVVDEENQSEYHKGNWQTLQGFIPIARQPVIDEFTTTLTEGIQKRLP